MRTIKKIVILFTIIVITLVLAYNLFFSVNYSHKKPYDVSDYTFDFDIIEVFDDFGITLEEYQDDLQLRTGKNKPWNMTAIHERFTNSVKVNVVQDSNYEYHFLIVPKSRRYQVEYIEDIVIPDNLTMSNAFDEFMINYEGSLSYGGSDSVIDYSELYIAKIEVQELNQATFMCISFGYNYDAYEFLYLTFNEDDSYSVISVNDENQDPDVLFTFE